MRKSPSKLWAFGPIFSILLIVVAYYLKVPVFRDAVNDQFPWAKEHLSQFVPAPKVVIVGAPPNAAVPLVPAEALPPRPAVPEQVRKAVLSTPAPKVHDEGFTLQTFAANRSLWPATVKLRCAIEFPAVLNGKVIGKLQAPAGTDARLVMINGQKLGLEYHGGGAWVAVSQTDLMEKFKITAR